MDKHDLTSGPILSNLVRLSWPGAVGRLFENLYDVVDMMWIGTLGGVLATQAQAGIIFFGVSNSIWQMLNSIFGPGSVTVIARYWGAKDYNKAAWASEQTILYKFLAGVLGALLGIFLLPVLLSWAGASTELVKGCEFSTMNMGLSYGRIMVLGLPLIFVYYTVNTIFRCTSDAESSMIVIASSSILNIILDPFFILGIGPFPHWGIFGAAVATMIAYLYADILAIFMLVTGKKITFKVYSLLMLPKLEGEMVRYRLRVPYFKIFLEERGIRIRLSGLFKPDRGILWTFLRIGATPTLSQFLGSGSSFIFMNLISRFGSSLVTAFGIGGKIAGIVNMPLLGVQQASAALVGQNLGAGKPERSEKTAWYSASIGVCLGAVMIVVAYFFTPQIFRLFNSDPAVIAIGSSVFVLAMISNTVNAAQWMLWSVFDGSGYTLWPSIFAQINSWTIHIALTYIFIAGLKLGYEWIFYTGIISGFVHFFTNWVIIGRGAWKKAHIGS